MVLLFVVSLPMYFLSLFKFLFIYFIKYGHFKIVKNIFESKNCLTVVLSYFLSKQQWLTIKAWRAQIFSIIKYTMVQLKMKT